MDKTKILKEINDIFIDVLENSNLKINESTTAEDIDEWDSLTHIMLVTAIEKFFNKKFTSTNFILEKCW